MANSQEKSHDETTDFGYERVKTEDKAKKVHDVFASVASSYDVMNDAMSGGLHRVWKDHFVNIMSFSDGDKMLDLAGGTGDITFRAIKRAERLGTSLEVTITDINEHMLEGARARAIDSNILKNLDFNIVNAEEMPYADNTFDFVTIAFGIRNVTDRDKALKEIYRVLKPGGRFLCLEFSHVDNPVLKKIYDGYSHNIVPNLGQMIMGDKASYQYLIESIRMFPNRTKFGHMIEGAGFSRVTNDILTHGVVAIHSGWKI
jgi:ubiquinone/menaquinone biosynthesis methyltransferase